MKEKRVLIISGPTGVGENTLVGKIVEKHPKFKRLVTATTRSPRPGEKNEVDYYFMTNEEFERGIEDGKIPEYQNNRDNKVYYGTYLPDLEKKLENGDNIIATTDIIGTRFFKKNHNATTIFIMPDSMESLEERHRKRDPFIQKGELEKRLEYAQYEIDNEREEYDFEVINAQGKIDEAVERILEIAKEEGYELD